MVKTVMKKRNKNLTAFAIILMTIAFLYTITLFIPLIWGFITSLKNVTQFNGGWLEVDGGKGDVLGFPNMRYWTEYKYWVTAPQHSPNTWKKYDFIKNYNNIFGNYYVVFKGFTMDKKDFSQGFKAGIFTKVTVPQKTGQIGFIDFVLNSVIYSVGNAVIGGFMPCFMGYLCSKYRYKFSSLIYSLVIIVMVTPVYGTVPVVINLLRNIWFYDSFIGNFIHNAAGWGGMYFLIFYAFFTSLSDSYNEAAEVDGASQLMVMFKICLPLAIKMMMTIALIKFTGFFNDYSTPMLYLPSWPTLSLAIIRMQQKPNMLNSMLDNVPTKIAAIMYLAIPLLTIFVVFNKQLMGNISMGGIKE
ncbi:MAG: carbohydrate ABC transporter permease [Clostridia bacterium]|nr:carbohydrate ABC transporter permease [Clostridia bacterium]